MTEIQPYEAHAVATADDTDSWVAVLEPVADLASKIANTDFVPKDFRGKTAAVAAAILFGREVGLPPMTTLKNTYVVHGTPDLSAEAQRALVLAAGHEIEFVETTATRCKMRGRRAGSETWTEAAYTMDEAKQSGDAAKNSNYRTRPVEMLIARCTSRLCSMAFPDTVGGFSSSVNAPLPHGEDDDQGESVSAPAKVTVTREEPAPKPKPAPRKKAAPKLPKPEPVAAVEAPEPVAIDGPPLPGEDGFEDIVAEPAAPEAPPQDEPASPQMVKALHSALTAAGLKSREDKLQFCGDVVGRTIASSKELTRSEVSDCLDTLSAPPADEPIDAEFID